MTGPARLQPPPRASLSPEVDGLLALASSPDGEALGTIAVLAHRPQLLGPFLGWAAALALEGTLSQRDHEILALRAAYRCQSPFEWGEHVGYGRRAGLSDGDIARLGGPPDAAGWTEAEAALVRAADELVLERGLGDDTWAALQRHFEAAALVEIVYVVGQYSMLSTVANALAIPPVTGSEPLPSVADASAG